jgi:hypothetical protein
MTKDSRQQLKEQLKQVKIEVKVNDKDREFAVFERFPDFVPYIAKGYGDSKKILLIWESYYASYKDSIEIVKSPEKWYFDAPQESIDKLREFGRQNEEACRHWNFASKMYPDGRDLKSRTFTNVASVFKEFIPKGKDPFSYCAGYNFYLRPAKERESIKDKPIDREIAAKTLLKVINILEPEYVLFLSEKSYEVFEAYRNKVSSKPLFASFCHPASPWWNRKQGKDKLSAKERFSQFLRDEVFNNKQQ